MQFRHFSFNINGSAIKGEIKGNQSAPLVVFLHGAAMDYRMFDRQVNALLQAGYRVLLWDLRGHGNSQPLGKTPISITDFTEDLCQLLEKLNISEKICLIGHSLGGLIVQDLVYRYPEKCTSFVIIGATCSSLPIYWWEYIALKSSPMWLNFYPYSDVLKMIATTSLSPHTQSYAYTAASKLNKDTFMEIWQAIANALNPKANYRIEIPFLLTHGQEDKAGNVAQSAVQWAKRDQDYCHYHPIPQAGHNANQDQADYFNQLMLSFLAQHHPLAGKDKTTFAYD